MPATAPPFYFLAFLNIMTGMCCACTRTKTNQAVCYFHFSGWPTFWAGSHQSAPFPDRPLCCCFSSLMQIQSRRTDQAHRPGVTAIKPTKTARRRKVSPQCAAKDRASETKFTEKITSKLQAVRNWRLTKSSSTLRSVFSHPLYPD